MDASPVISKSDHQKTNARLEKPVLFAGGIQGREHRKRREAAQERRLMQ